MEGPHVQPVLKRAEEGIAMRTPAADGDTNQTILCLRATVLPDGGRREVFVVQGRITFRPPAGGEVRVVLEDGYLLPGLVDAHAHLGAGSPAPEDASPEERARASARLHLDAGVLAIREPGGPDRASTSIGPHEGLPRVDTAGQWLVAPGRFFPGLGREVSDGVLPGAAVEEAHASGRWAKVIGDWGDAHPPLQPSFSAAALAEAAQRVHAVGARLAVHAMMAETIEMAIAAGADSIEHGVGLLDDHVTALAARRIALVPTLTPLAGVPLEKWRAVMSTAGWTASWIEARLAVFAQHPEMVRRAAAAGVLVLAGTDAGFGPPHGMIRGEIALLRQAGLPAESALAAGSWAARRFLGLPGIEEGAPADLTAYRDDPRAVPEVLAHPTLRLLDGRLLPLARP
jgi:imidazolonepropionase-like amidohydrolase